MDVTIDDYSRIVIPKSIRDRLGLESGSSLTLEIADSNENGESITLRPQGQEPPLQQSNKKGISWSTRGASRLKTSMS